MSKINKEAGIFLISPMFSSLFFGEKNPNSLAIAFRNYPKLPGIKIVMLHVLLVYVPIILQFIYHLI